MRTYIDKTSAGFIRQKRRKKIPSKFHLLLNKRWNPLPPSMFNEPGIGGETGLHRNKKNTFCRKGYRRADVITVHTYIGPRDRRNMPNLNY
jgi:hypothetical protein